MNKLRSTSFSSDDGSQPGGKELEEPILVYHESARSIVFRDHLRRVVRHSSSGNLVEEAEKVIVPETTKREDSKGSFAKEVDQYTHLATEIFDPKKETASPVEAGIPPTQIAGFQPKIVPLPAMKFGPTDEYQGLLNSKIDYESTKFTKAEKEVCRMLTQQKCTVKTIKNVDWTSFLNRFQKPNKNVGGRYPHEHVDIPPSEECHFNSFVTSTSLLPSNGLHMRCFGSSSQYTVGVVFALPNHSDPDTEEVAAKRTKTWSWPAGYSAKTEFNIDGRGRLINGREEALVPFSVLRQYNDDYINKDQYMVGNRMVSGLSQIPYNEVFLRVGGYGRLVQNRDCATGEYCIRSFDRGVGLPVALFVRTATYGHLITLLRCRARLMHHLGERHIKGIPLLLIDPEIGVRVLTESLQKNLWKVAATNLTPFQNSTIAHKTTVTSTDEQSFQQKVDELIDLDEEIRAILTPEELARLAGGFGATDDSVATILKDVMLQDKRHNLRMKETSEDGKTSDDAHVSKSHKLQDVVNEGLAAAVRSGDYHTSRQLLLLYSLVASQSFEGEDEEVVEEETDIGFPYDGEEKSVESKSSPEKMHTSVGMSRDERLMIQDLGMVKKRTNGTLSSKLPAPPPPPPLDTDRLRSATNCDGLLAVLGAAEVLKAMQNGSAKRRAEEAVAALEEWVEYGEQSMAFRISSWYDQRAAQGDLKIAFENESNFMAFVSNKALSNRRSFASLLRDAVSNTDFSDVRFLMAINEIVSKMHSPCLRLELLQYVLGLDNRYSVAHVKRSIELAASCLGIAASSR